MSLPASVDLVEHAFRNARQGDLFIRKAAACTMGDLAQAVVNLFRSDRSVTVIGTRHAEKLSEALASREELSRAEDMGDYFRINADKRDLNYGAFFEEGDLEQTQYADYDSHTVDRMSIDEVEAMLLTLPQVRAELALAGIALEPAA